jgi:uncharacterized membrane protein
VAEEAKKTKANLGTALKYLFGILLVAIGVALVIYWRSDVWTLIKGCLGGFVLLAGLIFIAIAKE